MFAGMDGDKEAFDRAMSLIADTLAGDPDHAEALVWRGDGRLFLSGQAFRRGAIGEGRALAGQGIADMERAVSLAPSEIAVRIPRAAGLMPFARGLRPFDRPEADRLTRVAMGDFEFAMEASVPQWSKLGEHNRGELLESPGRWLAAIGRRYRQGGCLPRPHDQRAAWHALCPQRRAAPRRSGEACPATPASAVDYEMRWHLLMAAAALVVATTTASVGAESVTFQSGSYTDFRQLLSREAPPAYGHHRRHTDLSPTSQEKIAHPAVVLVHMIAGYLEANERLARRPVSRSRLCRPDLRQPGRPEHARDPELHRARRPALGDLPLPRPIPGPAPAGQQPPDRCQPDRHRRILGLAARWRTWPPVEPLRAALVPGQIRFAAHVAYYPAGVYGVMAEQGAYTGAPVLLLLGDKDDNLPVAKGGAHILPMSGMPAMRRRSRYRSIRGRTTPGPFPAWAPRASARNTPARENVRIFCWDRRSRRSSSMAGNDRWIWTPCDPA